mgnify:CR=1 FL=1
MVLQPRNKTRKEEYYEMLERMFGQEAPAQDLSGLERLRQLGAGSIKARTPIPRAFRDIFK